MRCSAWSRAPKRRTTAGAAISTRCASRHNTIAEGLLSADARQLYMAGFDRDRHDIEGILHTVKLTRSRRAERARPDRRLRRDLVDQAVPRILRARANGPGDVQWIDARQAVVVEWGPLGPAVQWDESRAKLAALVGPDFQGHAHHHGLHRLGPAGRADHARAATAATSRARSSARCSTPAKSTSGPTSTACCRPIRAACRMPRSSIRCRTTKPWSSRTSAPR